MLTRVPRPDGQGMTPTPRLVLDVKEFEVKGSYGAETWGSPRDVETDERIHEWTEGLKGDGGGGYVLEMRSHVIVD